jgi:D-beta-D-heptose 7-phosphate kinase/D-beta-D-heptose 1-phosphate adenosyltransferase
MIFKEAKALADYLTQYRAEIDEYDYSEDLANYEKSVVVVSGGFDPLHIGHLRYIERAYDLAAILIAIVNGDGFLQRKRKTHGAYQNEDDRAAIIHALGVVDHVLIYDDGSQFVANALKEIKPNIFANGGDRSKPGQMPECETSVCKELGIEVVGGVGGSHKADSSSDFLKRMQDGQDKARDTS